MSSLDESGVWDPGEKSGEPITEFDRKVWRALSKGGQWLPKEHKSYMVDYLALNQPPIHVSQLLGFSQYNANYAQVVTQENTTSATYTNLATTGPELTGIGDGQYLVGFGANAFQTGLQFAYASVSANGAAPSDDDKIQFTQTFSASASRFLLVTLTAGSNSLRVQYRTDNSGTFSDRWLVAVRVANA